MHAVASTCCSGAQVAAERLPADHEPLQPPTPEAWLQQPEAVPLLDLPDFPLLPGVELAGEVQQRQRQQHLQPPLQQQRITTFIGGAGGRGPVERQQPLRQPGAAPRQRGTAEGGIARGVMHADAGERALGGGARQAHRQPRRRGPGGGGGGSGAARMYRGGAAADALPLGDWELGSEDERGPGAGVRQLAGAAIAASTLQYLAVP